MIAADLTDIAREALILAVAVSLPIIGAAFAASLLGAALQSFTKLSDPAATQIARIAAVLACAVVAGPWIAREVANFAARTLTLIHDLVG